MLRKLLLAIPAALLAAFAAHRLVPGALGGGVVLLPSGWRIHPAGRSVAVGTLPLALIRMADGALLVSNDGYGWNGLMRLDPAAGRVTDSVPFKAAWLGLDHRGSAAADTVWASAGTWNRVYRVIFAPGAAPAVDSAVLAAPKAKLGVAGVAVVPGHDLVAVLGNLDDSLRLLDARTLEPRGTVAVGHRPYAVVADSTHLYVSNWGDSTISIVDLTAGPPYRPTAQFIGPHPSALALGRGSLFATLAGVNGVARLDLATGRVREQLTISLGRHAPLGSDPNALALAPGGRTLYVPLAGNNAVAVVRIGRTTMRVAGLIPAGWYPTAVTTSADGRTLYVANGKGAGSGANPTHTYIGSVISGTVSIVPVPDSARLARYTAEAAALSPYSNPRLRAAQPAGPHPGIRHVVYVIRENRTYDQVLGDVPEGDGDPALAIFNDSVTPNAHAIARKWVLFDNFYVDGEVSADGHEWTDRAFAGEYNEKTWPAIYSDRRDWDLDDGDDLANPAGAYVWDAARRAGRWVVNFGEAVAGDSLGPYHPTIPGLRGVTAPEYPGFVLGIGDTTRAAMFADSVSSWDRQARFPDLVILYLPRDHTRGKRAAEPTPRAMVAENDLALGRVIARLTRSPAWSSTAVFVLEDDAQDGPDHVDAHRSVLLVASPYARRGAVDSTLYTTSSVVRTIGQILGLPPLSQYDAAASPLWRAFSQTADMTPFTALANRWPVNELNPHASRSGLLDRDFAGPDLADEVVLNREIWESVRPRERMPAPRRAYVVGGN